MQRTRWWIAGIVAMAFGICPALAQVGGGGAAAPTGGGAAGATGGGTAANGAGAATAGAAEAKPGFFKKCCLALEECKRKLCKTPAGQMINSMTLPMSTMTGGIIPSFCPLMPSAADLAKSGVDGAAANAKKDALEAKERVKAVRYLGTLDCRYYPEAELALIAALRMDRVECVRWEAAMALGRGCCCTRKVIEALEISVSGSEKDGNPSERSERVRDAAFFALNHCLMCYRETPKEVDDKDINREKPPIEKKKEGELPAPKVTKTDREVLDKARQTVALYGTRREPALPAAMATQQAVLPKGQRSLYHIIRYGAEGPSQQVATQPMTQPMSRPVPQPDLIVAPRELPRVQSIPAERPMPRVSQGPAVVPPVEKPVAPVAAAEPTDPPVTPQVLNLRPEEVAPPVSAPMTTIIDRAPAAPEAAPATIQLPISDENTISNLIDGMLTGSTPKDRHQSIRSIVSHDWRKYPQIVAALVKTARLDSDRAVRVNAIRQLALLNIDVPYVFDHLKYMQKDQDDWVRQESTAALEKLVK